MPDDPLTPPAALDDLLAELLLESEPSAERPEFATQARTWNWLPGSGEATTGPLDVLIAQLDDAVRLAPLRLQGKEDADTGIAREDMVVFVLGGTRYAVPVQQVIETERLPAVTSLPNLPDFIPGVTNRRGEITAVLDLRSFFGLAPPVRTENRRMLVVRAGPERFPLALIVDEVRGLAKVPGNLVVRPTTAVDRQLSPMLRGIWESGQQKINVLDLTRIFLAPAMRHLGAW